MFTEEQKKALAAMIAEANAAYFASEEGKKALAGVASAAVTEANAATATALAAVTTKVEALATAAPKTDDKGGKKVEGAEMPEWFKPFAEAQKKSDERFAKMDAAEADTTAKATRSTLIEKTLNDAKHGGMLATHKTFINSLHAAGVTKPEQITEALTAYKAEMKAAGVEIKETVASPAGEGAKGPTPEDTEAAALERIQANAKNRPGSLAEVGKPKV